MGKEENDGPSLTRKFRASVTGRQPPLMGTGPSRQESVWGGILRNSVQVHGVTQMGCL